MTKENTKSKTAVAYLRINAQHDEDRDRQELALDAQREIVEKRAAMLGVTLDAEFIDIGSANDHQRPGLEAMLEYLEDNTNSYCITANSSRLSRNILDHLRIVTGVQSVGAELVDSEDAVSEHPQRLTILTNLVSALNEMASTQHSRAVKEGIRRKKEQQIREQAQSRADPTIEEVIANV